MAIYNYIRAFLCYPSDGHISVCREDNVRDSSPSNWIKFNKTGVRESQMEACMDLLIMRSAHPQLAKPEGRGRGEREREEKMLNLGGGGGGQWTDKNV